MTFVFLNSNKIIPEIIDVSMVNTIQNNHLKTTGLISRIFANGPGDRGSIPGRVIPKTQKMVLDAALVNTQHCKDQE